MKYFFRKAVTSNDDNSMLQMTALVSVVSFLVLVLFSKGQTPSQPSGNLAPRSSADQTQFNAILCCSMFSYYLLLLFLD